MARRVAVALVGLFALSGPAHGEYVPGFTLLGHGGDTPKIVEAEINVDGHVTVLAVLRGGSLAGKVPELSRNVAWHRPEKAGRAILFLAADDSVARAEDVAWIDAEGLVHLLPDNWGWGVSYPVSYRPPTMEQFRESLATAARDWRDVTRIASLESGADRAWATSRLLSAERPENSWYVYRGSSLASHLKLLWESFARNFHDEHDYREELRLALRASMTSWSHEERTAFRSAIAALGPGGSAAGASPPSSRTRSHPRRRRRSRSVP